MKVHESSLLIVFVFDVFTYKAASLTALIGHSNIKMMTCNSSNKTILPDYKCFAKAYSRNNQTMNVLMFFPKPVYEAFVALEVSYKTTTSPNYRTLINSTIDVCGFLNGTNNNPLVKWFFSVIRESLPKNFLHPCPYIVSRLNFK
jgi:hypothetical protein